MGRISLAPDSVLLGKYRVERVLGQGGMGTVVSARHISLGDVVAIKVLSDDVGITDELARRFTREAQAAAKLKSPHVVRVSDVGQLEDGAPFMVMEMLEGSDLAQLITEHGAFDPPVAVGAVLQACEVLAEAHARGIVHRDIKPSNLFVTNTDDGTLFVKVLDFGIAKAPDSVGAPITRTLSMLGTPAYMSPEQLRSSREVDHRTDIWSLGCVLYELLEGHRVFDAATLPELIIQVAITPNPAPVRTPARLAAIVQRCLAKESEDRFQSVEDLASALVPFTADPRQAALDLERMKRLARGLPRADPTPVPARSSAFAAARTLPEPRRRARRIALVVVGTLVVGVAAFATIELVPRAEPTSPAAIEPPPLPVHPVERRPTESPPIVVAPQVQAPPPPPNDPQPPDGSGDAVKITSHQHRSPHDHTKVTSPAKPVVSAPDGSGSAVKAQAGSNGGSAAPCDPYSRLGC